MLWPRPRAAATIWSLGTGKCGFWPRELVWLWTCGAAKPCATTTGADFGAGTAAGSAPNWAPSAIKAAREVFMLGVAEGLRRHDGHFLDADEQDLGGRLHGERDLDHVVEAGGLVDEA